MSFLKRLFSGGKKPQIPAPSAVPIAHVPNKSVTTSQSQVQNLLRWEKSGFPQKWVEDHRGQWTHSDWLDLLKKLKLTDYWPMEPNEIGQLIEKISQKTQQLASTRDSVKDKVNERLSQNPYFSLLGSDAQSAVSEVLTKHEKTNPTTVGGCSVSR